MAASVPALPEVLKARDGITLRMREWRLERARGSFLVVHGLGEHIGRFDRFARRLNDIGWRVAGYDQRGHGLSGGARGSLRRDDDLLADLALVIDTVRDARPGPLVLFGDSMGGLVAARMVAEALARSDFGIARAPAQQRPSDVPAPSGGATAGWARCVDALVLASPALDPDLDFGQRVLLALLGPLASVWPDRLAVRSGIDAQWLSRDPGVALDYEADPLVHDRVTPRLARFIVEAGRFVLERAGAWLTPTLLLWAGADRCVAPAGSAAFAAAAPSDVVRAHCLDGYFHEIFNEPEREREAAFALLENWLAKRFATRA